MLFIDACKTGIDSSGDREYYLIKYMIKITCDYM